MFSSCFPPQYSLAGCWSLCWKIIFLQNFEDVVLLSFLYLKLLVRGCYPYACSFIYVFMYVCILNCAKIYTNIKFPILTILGIQFRGIKYIHIFMSNSFFCLFLSNWIFFSNTQTFEDFLYHCSDIVSRHGSFCLFVLLIFFFLTALFSLWDINLWTQDWTRVPCSGSEES